MSLTSSEKKQTSAELRENFKVLGFTAEKIEADLHLRAGEIEKILNISAGANPTTVWKLRDYMEEKILQQGKTPYPYTVLIGNIYYPYKKDWN